MIFNEIETGKLLSTDVKMQMLKWKIHIIIIIKLIFSVDSISVNS